MVTGMASRPFFIPAKEARPGVHEKSIGFKWYPGMAASQKKKSIASLHQEIKSHGYKNILEISSKSEDKLGVALSAFNLTFTTKKYAKSFTVESAFQGSKVFSGGGPFKDLFSVSPLEAKRDLRLRESGDLLRFEFFGESFSNKPRTFFYDWLYINALRQHQEYVNQILSYDGFTDIEFNPKKSINCQAHSVALFVSLHANGLLDTAMSSQELFLATLEAHYKSQTRNVLVQSSLM